MMVRVLKFVGKLLGMGRALPHLVWYGLGAAVLGPERAFGGASERVARIPGQWGVYTRQAFYRWTIDSLGSDVYFGFMSLLSKRHIRIGDGVYIGRFCCVGMAYLGASVMLADGVQILSGRHQHGSASVNGAGLQDNEQSYCKVVIGDGAWLGASAVVMADVGPRAVVGAGAVVVKPVEPGSKVVGCPARPIGA